MVLIDVQALKAASARDHAGEHCMVSRKWLADVLVAVTDPSQVKLVNVDDAGPTPMVVA